jgi:hypothetical protein
VYLAEALSKYVEKKTHSFTFRSGLSLNQFALAMWEKSSTCGIDSSVLSKVLNGKRLFTPYQLSVFCRTLNLKRSEREYLFYCLHKDDAQKSGLKLSAPFIPAFAAHQFLGKLIHTSEVLFQTGKWKNLYSLSGTMESFLHEYASIMHAYNPEDSLISIYQKILYLRAKSIASVQHDPVILRETRILVRKFRRYSNNTFGHLTEGYIHSFESSAYRVLGLYHPHPHLVASSHYIKLSQKSAAKALHVLPPTNNEYLVCLRNLLDSYIILGNKEMFVHHIMRAERFFSSQLPANFLSSMHLASTIGKGKAVFGLGDPFILKAKVKKHFGKNLTGAGIHELSDIKAELETHLALKTKRNVHLEQKIQRALTLASEESEHYTPVISRLAEQF